MKTIKKDDNLVLRKDYPGGSYKAGTKAVALDDWSGPDSERPQAGLVRVRWENGLTEHVYGWRFDVVNEKSASSADDLIRRYAEELRKGIENGTMESRYSHVGIFASFLNDYRSLEK